MISFNLFNGPDTFQNYINKILAKNFDIFVIVYFDNISICSKNHGQAHIEALCWVLDTLRKDDFFANFKMCHFHQNEFCFLGYFVFAQEIQIEDEKLKTIKS